QMIVCFFAEKLMQKLRFVRVPTRRRLADAGRPLAGRIDPERNRAEQKLDARHAGASALEITAAQPTLGFARSGLQFAEPDEPGGAAQFARGFHAGVAGERFVLERADVRLRLLEEDAGELTLESHAPPRPLR